MQIWKIQKPIQENVFCLWDNCISIGCVKLSLLRREYLSLAVNVLTNCFQILHVTKGDIFRINFLRSDQ